MKQITQPLKQKAHIYLCILIVAVITPYSSIAQPKPSAYLNHTKKPPSSSWIIAPAVLIGVGLFTMTDNGLITRNGVQHFRNTHFPNFSYTADDYLQYTPIAIELGLKALGVKTSHNWRTTIELLIKTEVAVGFFVTALKRITQEPRPGGGSLNSFPSGHTAQAFAGATFLHKEIGKQYPWISVGGYTLASIVGLMRILRNKHWVSDVLVGAGLGILLTQLIYLAEENAQKKNIKISVVSLPNGAPALGVAFPIQ